MCYGTRPQVIKASVLSDVLGDRWDLLTVDTGQHYDHSMHGVLYEQLGIARPGRLLDIGAADRPRQVARILARAAGVFARERPWAVVVIGDTSSTLGCAIAAAQIGIPVVHIEAGLRVGDGCMAEEVNRRAVDSFAALLCAPSERAAAQLALEHVTGVVERTGDVARDVLLRNIARAPAIAAVPGLPAGRGACFLFATLHRAELTGDVDALSAVLAGLAHVPKPVILSAHPRLLASLRQHALLDGLAEGIHVTEPLGYLETLACVRDAAVVITDSGGVQREAYWLGTPCITVRDETEWAETVQLGANVVVPPRRAALELPGAVDARMHRAGRRATWDRDAFGDGHAALRVRDAIARLGATIADPASA